MQFSFVDPVNNKALVLPIAPERMQATIGTKVLVFDPIALGTIELPRGRLPTRFSLEGLLPGEFQTAIPDLASELTPQEIISTLRKWTEAKGASGKKVRFIVTETDWNIPVFLSTFEPSEPNGFGDVRYSLSLTEFRDFTVKEVKPNTSSKKNARETKPKPKSVTVQKGENLSVIARKYCGSANKWTELWAANKGKLKSGNPNLIYPGEKLTIPERWLT
ncbi:phage protein [Sporosarcina sp. NCCP-2222]|uniref:LysM peptidoglycan-binding domain-containing protein n=1 Tax=Sporosarcina sp. NCCP-2222 TaxID=2935073 RepID=UPI002083F35A|nr:LysM peptidoglycan-binding domain-containing protein [Sporosarcina sp. NCCP-2222]GKV54234.1 phage protein [Sporosarcina sp. NCCP-2222]